MTRPLTPFEFAAALSPPVTRQRVYQMIASGEIRAERFKGGPWLIDPGELTRAQCAPKDKGGRPRGSTKSNSKEKQA